MASASFSEYFKLLRVHQYPKNLFIFLPLFFALKITRVELAFSALLSFIAFCMAASSVYILNDIRDVEDDRQHPTKCKRPLASGAISMKVAYIYFSCLILASALLMGTLSFTGLAIIAFYLILNVAYSIKLKHIAIFDVIIIAIGFVLRLFVGSVVTAIPLSMWIVIMTFLLALFLALAKRRDDVIIFETTGKKMRKVIDGYNRTFLDNSMILMAGIVIVAYIQYTVTDEIVERIGSRYLYFTAIFVLMGILRYLQIAFVDENSGSPSKVLLKDRFIQLTIVGWIATFTWILYL